MGKLIYPDQPAGYYANQLPHHQERLCRFIKPCGHLLQSGETGRQQCAYRHRSHQFPQAEIPGNRTIAIEHQSKNCPFTQKAK